MMLLTDRRCGMGVVRPRLGRMDDVLRLWGVVVLGKRLLWAKKWRGRDVDRVWVVEFA